VYSEVTCDRHAQVGLVGGNALGELGDKAPAATSSDCDVGGESQRVGTVVLQPAGSRDEEIAFQLVTRNDDRGPETCTAATGYAGCIVAKRQLHFTPHQNTTLRVDLRISCLDKPCVPDETCVNHQCVSAQVDPNCTQPCGENQLPGAQGTSSPEDAGADSSAPDSSGQDAATEAQGAEASVPDASSVDAAAPVVGSGYADHDAGTTITSLGIPVVGGTNPGDAIVLCVLLTTAQSPLTVTATDSANNAYTQEATANVTTTNDALFLLASTTGHALTNGSVNLSFTGANHAIAVALHFSGISAFDQANPAEYPTSCPGTFDTGTITTTTAQALVLACAGMVNGSLSWSSSWPQVVVGPTPSHDSVGAVYSLVPPGSYSAGGTCSAQPWMTILSSFH
jgi:hypothetical protein